MKKLIISTLLMATGLTCFCQQTSQALPAVKTDYLKKSKKQKTAAWIMLGGGFLVAATGTAIAASDATEEVTAGLVGAIIGEEIETSSSNTGDILFFTGLAAMGGSIPLFVASSKNKKKAAAVTAGIKMENGTLMRQATLGKVQYPSLSVKIGL